MIPGDAFDDTIETIPDSKNDLNFAVSTYVWWFLKERCVCFKPNPDLGVRRGPSRNRCFWEVVQIVSLSNSELWLCLVP